MNRVGAALRTILCLPPVWIALIASVLAVAFNGWEPVLDIARYAVERLFG